MSNMKEYLKRFDTHAEYEEYLTGSTMIKSNVSYCLDDRDLHYNPWSWAEEYLTFVTLGSGTFKFVGSDLEYSLDNGETWENLPSNTSTPYIIEGTKILWRGYTQMQPYMGPGTFSSTNKYEVKGNVLSIIYRDDFRNYDRIPYTQFSSLLLFSNDANLVSAKDLYLPTKLVAYCYSRMFSGCTGLIEAPELPSTELTQSCYSYMFQGCTSLTSAPQLPATTLASVCYQHMFSGCTSLTTAPKLHATTLASGCYCNMFQDCTGLTTAPTLPATTLAQSCYANMFQGCTGLTTAPTLPATTLAQSCYRNMFSGCTSLTSAPQLPATTLENYCYGGMFEGCTNLTKSPELPATALAENCYRDMFRGCTNINYIKAMFTTTPSTTYTNNWVNGVAENGVFIKNSAAEWDSEDVRGVNGVPTNWTVRS